MKRGVDDMNMRAPRFDFSFNFGHVLTSISLMLSIAGSVWWMSERLSGFEHRIAASEARGALYAPRVDALMKSNDVQDERIGNMADSIRGIRSDIADNNRAVRGDLSDTNKNVANLRESMATVNAKLETLLRKN